MFSKHNDNEVKQLLNTIFIHNQTDITLDEKDLIMAAKGSKSLVCLVVYETSVVKLFNCIIFYLQHSL